MVDLCCVLQLVAMIVKQSTETTVRRMSIMCHWHRQGVKAKDIIMLMDGYRIPKLLDVECDGPIDARICTPDIALKYPLLC